MSHLSVRGSWVVSLLLVGCNAQDAAPPKVQNLESTNDAGLALSSIKVATLAASLDAGPDLAKNPCLELGPDTTAGIVPSLNNNPVLPNVPGLGEGAELEFGGWGFGSGKFTTAMRNLAFDNANNLYVLDGGQSTNGTRKGNFLIQKFTESGSFVSQFSVYDATLGDNNDPFWMAIDSFGQFYVTEPKAEMVLQYSSNGQLIRRISVAKAKAVAVRSIGGSERVYVANNNDAVQILNPNSGQIVSTIPLSRRLDDVQDIAINSLGEIFILAYRAQIYKFSAAGQFLAVIGSGANDFDDGNHFISGISFDSQDFLYATTHGNPGQMTKIDPTMTYMIQRGGQFSWYDAWSLFGGHAPITIDKHDRMWLLSAVGNPNNDTDYSHDIPGYHYRQVVIKPLADFFATSHAHDTLSINSVLAIGLQASIDFHQLYSISYTPGQSLNVDFVASPASRVLPAATVLYKIYDFDHHLYDSQQVNVTFTDGVETRSSFAFTPPKYGWYSATAHICRGGTRVRSVSNYLGVTPPYSNMKVLAPGESTGDMVDSPRAMFSGFPNLRLSAKDGLDKLDTDLTIATLNGATIFVQLNDHPENLTPQFVSDVANRFKNRVHYYEVLNEPNYSLTPESYANYARMVRDIVKGVDPTAKIMGPSTVNVDLNWMERFYNAGGKDAVDIIAVHDYEGHESIDPNHWNYKFNALKNLMASHGDAQKPIWQTERAISATRKSLFTGIEQAARMTLRYDVMENLGIPAEHNMNYYLNEMGFDSVPSYVWSGQGPFPAAMTMRTRRAQTVGKTFDGSVEFGTTGNKFLMGLKFSSPQTKTYLLRTIGVEKFDIHLNLSGGTVANKIDTFGNKTALLVSASGAVDLSLSEMPLYLEIPSSENANFVPIDYGTNLMSGATFSYSSTHAGPDSNLNNGVMETYQDSDPHGNPDGNALWRGAFVNGTPQTLQIQLSGTKTVGTIALYGMPSDNTFSEILDFDVQALVNGNWVAVANVISGLPTTDHTEAKNIIGINWLHDRNNFVVQFNPVQTDRLRVIFNRTSRGCRAPDAWVNEVDAIDAEVDLKEIEVYSVGKTQSACPGDLNGDRKVGFDDLLSLAQAYGTSVGSAGFNAAADLNGDGSISFEDLLILSSNYGNACSP